MEEHQEDGWEHGPVKERYPVGSLVAVDAPQEGLAGEGQLETHPGAFLYFQEHQPITAAGYYDVLGRAPGGHVNIPGGGGGGGGGGGRGGE